MENPLMRIKIAYTQAALSNAGNDALYFMIFDLIRTAIQNGDLPAGTKLPPSRKLAESLEVSRSTIIQAYDLLKVGRLIRSRAGSGLMVQAVEQSNGMQQDTKLIQYPKLSRTGQAFLDTVKHLERVGESYTAFRPGLPPIDIFPVNQWKLLNNLYWHHVNDDELSLVSISGTTQLRNSLANYLNFTRKIKCDPRQIIIVSGSLQSIYAINTILLNPGDSIVHENPTFPNIISIFKGFRSNVIPVGIDQAGLDVDKIRSLNTKSPRIIHTAPSCHYPLGIRMSIERRKELLQYASEHNVMIIENDYEHEVNNYYDFIPSIYSMDQENRTFFLGTFNRLMHPSIRIGYMIVPMQYLEAIEALLRHLHRFVPNSKQMVLSQFIDKSYIYKHIQNLIEVAEERKRFFIESFYKLFKNEIQILTSDTMSLHLVALLKEQYTDQKLIRAFNSGQISAHSLSKTYSDAHAKQGLILGYTPVKRADMQRNLKKMLDIYTKMKPELI